MEKIGIIYKRRHDLEIELLQTLNKLGIVEFSTFPSFGSMTCDVTIRISTEGL